MTAGSDVADEQLDGLLIEYNGLYGGYQYATQLFEGVSGKPLNITLRNNRYGRDYHGYGTNGPVSDSTVGAGYTKTGNVWDDTGTAIP